jgi:hypothetical protein
MNCNKKIIPLVLATTISQGLIPTTMAFADDNLNPHSGVYGYYVDNYTNNTPANLTPASNPSIGVLSGFLKIFTPGDSWNNGTILNESVYEHNTDTVIDMTSNNTTAAAVSTTSGAARVYLDDRRNKVYSVTDGLGSYTDLFRELSGERSSISDVVPQDATTVQYTEKYDGSWSC